MTLAAAGERPSVAAGRVRRTRIRHGVLGELSAKSDWPKGSAGQLATSTRRRCRATWST
jgi:hypothetical protein